MSNLGNEPTAESDLDTTLLDLLARGGMSFDANDPWTTLAGKYNGMADPQGAEVIGKALARSLKERDPVDVVVVWEDIEDVVLAHVVARELGTGVIRAFDADGIVGYSGPLPARPQAVMVTDLLRDDSPLRALRSLLERQGGALRFLALLGNPGKVEFDGTVLVVASAADFL